ncbi:MAG: dienelactone hydrolase family protein [Myxococcota bacterium]|nr:dienelactone hydrolase family protein [Myxococcota bacterium]
MTTAVTFTAKTVGRVVGALAEPSGSGKIGGVVVVQEWFGVNDHIKSLCDRFSQAGFLALAPDLFHGKLPTNEKEAGQTLGSLDKKNALSEVGAAVTFLKEYGRCNGKVAVVGFCMGGGLTFAAARYVDGLAAAAPFYGLPDVPIDEFATLKHVPIQAHFAKRDDWAKASVAEEIQKMVRSGGGEMDLYVYDAGHAFMRNTDPQKYDAPSAKVAWERTMEFLKKHLS